MSKSKIPDTSFKLSLSQKFREKRFKFFKDLIASFGTEKQLHILDVGGTEAYWENMDFTTVGNIHITLLNLKAVRVKHKNFSSVKGDATDLSAYPDKHFDIVFSNSVIEHLFNREAQRKMAKEIRRVGKCYYVQTPNYWFPMEPHWMFPFFQFMPFKMRVFLTKNFDLGYYPKCVTKKAAIERVEEVKLLTEGEMKELFSEGKVYREFLLGLKKSITMYHFPVSR
jgi:hypothetical protein